MGDALERRFALNGLSLAALEWPGEGVPVIALHGWLDNAASFLPLAGELQGCHLLALELPGHGHSDHLPAAAHYHLADNLTWVAAVAEAMGWPLFVLLGHSMGAAISCLVAAMMPQRVAGIALIDGLGPIAYSPESEVQRVRELFSRPPSTPQRRPFANLRSAAILRRRHSRFAISKEAASLLVERNLIATDGGYNWRYDERLKLPASHYYSEEQVRGILGQISCPALLIRAEEGALKGWRGFAERLSALPSLQHSSLPGGHHLHMESPRLVAAQLQPFFSSLEVER